jgi:hypothetical protein
VACLAEVISRFDVVALQEARRSTEALRFLLERLGPAWRVIASDVTEGSAGNCGPCRMTGRELKAPT